MVDRNINNRPICSMDILTYISLLGISTVFLSLTCNRFISDFFLSPFSLSSYPLSLFFIFSFFYYHLPHPSRQSVKKHTHPRGKSNRNSIYTSGGALYRPFIVIYSAVVVDTK